MPDMPWSGRIVTPSVSVGMMKSEIPACLGASGSVRAASQMWVDTAASEVQIFWPWMIQPPSTLSARVRSAARSVPALGSL
jgi:hypothetical protein